MLRGSFIMAVLFLLLGCITAHKELNGKYTKVAQVENRSLFGTNQGFARLERCDGPEKKVLWFSESDFTNCVYLTKADQNEYEHASSRGAGPEIVSALVITSGLGPALALRNASSAVATSTSVASPMVNIRKHY